jgi:hydrogenase maturation protease
MPKPERVAQILIAGVGNAWMRDDGFGGEVVQELLKREMPDGVTVLDFGTGGLNLAYEVMRGYDGLILVDASQQGEEPGTLYVMEALEEDVEQGIQDGEMLDPHAMDPASVLRFVRTVGGWPGKVMVIGCEPEEVDQAGYGVSATVAAAVAPACDLVLDTARQLGELTLVAQVEADETARRGAAAAAADAAAQRARAEAMHP